jgi:hypothetical protein
MESRKRDPNMHETIMIIYNIIDIFTELTEAYVHTLDSILLKNPNTSIHTHKFIN